MSVVFQKKAEHWSNLKEVGSLLGFQFLLLVYRLFGRPIFTVFLWPVVLYFVLVHRTQRNASREYLEKLHRFSPSSLNKPPTWRHVITHYMSFGHAILDKLLAWCIELKEENFAIEQPEEVERLLNDERGQLIIGSHFGNLEYCRGFVQSQIPKVINVLLYDQHSANYVEMMKKINPDSRVNLFQVTDLDIPTFLLLKNKVAAGEWLFIAGDRIPLSGDQHTVNVNFLGEPAPFPVGPYLLAKTLECPVKLMFAYKKNHKIQFDVVPFAERIELPRKNREQNITHLAQTFATALEKRCVKAPFQWFNFYSFWSKAPEPSKMCPSGSKTPVHKVKVHNAE